MRSVGSSQTRGRTDRPLTADRRRGLVVCVCGPDGTGKTSLSTALVEGPGRAFASARVLHWRPGVLPRLGALTGRPAPDGVRPHAAEPYGRLVSTGRLLYYWLDFVAGSLLRIRRVRRAGGVVVLERGYWDMVVDPVRYRLGVAPRLIAALGRLVSEPDLTIVLLGDAGVIAARTHELSVGEIGRQMVRWRALARGRERWRLVDATQPLERIRSEASMLILGRRDRAIDG
jgi:thymidylate kinase